MVKYLVAKVLNNFSLIHLARFVCACARARVCACGEKRKHLVVQSKQEGFTSTGASFVCEQWVGE